MGPSFSVEKDGDVLVYKTYGSGHSLKTTNRIKPSLHKWKEFWEVCDRIGIWAWHRRYENPRILDGFSWRVIIEFGDKRVDSSGSNEGPDKLRSLLNAVSELVGKRNFY